MAAGRVARRRPSPPWRRHRPVAAAPLPARGRRRSPASWGDRPLAGRRNRAPARRRRDRPAAGSLALGRWRDRAPARRRSRGSHDHDSPGRRRRRLAAALRRRPVASARRARARAGRAWGPRGLLGGRCRRGGCRAGPGTLPLGRLVLCARSVPLRLLSLPRVVALRLPALLLKLLRAPGGLGLAAPGFLARLAFLLAPPLLAPPLLLSLLSVASAPNVGGRAWLIHLHHRNPARQKLPDCCNTCRIEKASRHGRPAKGIYSHKRYVR